MAGKRFRAVKTVEFDYGHRIPRHDSKCRNVHGHRGRLEAVVEGCLQTNGSSMDMVMDFGHIKRLLQEEIVDRFDHCMLIDANDTDFKTLYPQLEGVPELILGYLETNAFGLRYDVLNFGIVQELNAGAPTAEIIAYACYEALKAKMPQGVCIKMVRFWETPSSVAEYSEPEMGITLEAHA